MLENAFECILGLPLSTDYYSSMASVSGLKNTALVRGVAIYSVISLSDVSVETITDQEYSHIVYIEYTSEALVRVLRCLTGVAATALSRARESLSAQVS